MRVKTRKSGLLITKADVEMNENGIIFDVLRNASALMLHQLEQNRHEKETCKQ